MAMAITAILLLLFASLAHAKHLSIIDNNNHKPIDQNTDGRSDEEVMGIYRDWMAMHGKAYNGIGERERRFEVFKDNLRFIDDHNSANRTYKVGLNRFADLTNEEYRSMYLGARTDAKRRFVKAKVASRRYAVEEGEKLPESVDWRETGAVAPIKDQGRCGKLLIFC